MRIFISFSIKDRYAVDLLQDRFTPPVYEIFAQADAVKCQSNIEAAQRKMAWADVALLLISSNSLTSQSILQDFSWLALTELSNPKLRIIPIRLDDSPVPSYLLKHAYIDFSAETKSGLDALTRLLELLEERGGNRHHTGAESIRESADHRADSRGSQLAGLRSALKAGKLTLICGAGVSVDAGIPNWNELLLKLLSSMIERISKDSSLNFGPDAAAYFSRRHGATSLILGKYLKNNLGSDFRKLIGEALYADKPTSCPLITAIIELSRPQRDGKPLDSIITFNFDGLIEEGLAAANIQNRPIYSEAIRHCPNEIPVYHVHGYLPRDGNIPDEADLVFSEDAYHSQFIDPFSWSNLIQLNKLTQSTCLFVGVSLTDPNLRRLLDVAWRKNNDKTISHYIIKKSPGNDDKDDLVGDLVRLLEEQDANALGIQVIWVKDYDEIPALLADMRGGGTFLSY